MSFDEIAVIGFHDPHDAGKIGGSVRVQGVAELRRRCRQLGNDVRDGLGNVFDTRRLGALSALDFGSIFGRFFIFHKEMKIQREYAEKQLTWPIHWPILSALGELALECYQPR